MPREQKTEVEAGSGAEVFDAFSLAKDHVPQALEPAPSATAEQAERAPPEAPDPPPKRKAKPPARARARAAPEKPEIRRIGRPRTGRSVQFNQSVTAETANAYYDTARELGIPMGAVLERAIAALLEKIEREGQGARR